MGVGRGAVGALVTSDFENFSKKGCFLSLQREKKISPLLAPPRKILENPLVAPLEKIPRPMLVMRLVWHDRYLNISQTNVCNATVSNTNTVVNR